MDKSKLEALKRYYATQCGINATIELSTLRKLIALAERATSPVSQMTDKDAHDLVRRVEAHMERWVAENRCADSIKSSGEMVRYLLAAAAPHAQAPAEQQEREAVARICPMRASGIPADESDQFIELMAAWRHCGIGDEAKTAFDKIVSHIDDHTAAAVAKAREEGCTELRRQDHEQACRITHALMAERDEWKARTAAAEAKLEAIRQGLENLDRYDADYHRGDGVWLVAKGAYIDRADAIALTKGA